MEPNKSRPIKLHPEWQEALAGEFTQDYMQNLRAFLLAEKKRGKIIVPCGDEIFAALNLTPLRSVRVVIVGQDPYHGPGQAHGLSFSVRPGVAIPPSLVNIYKELREDLGVPPAQHGCLEAWAKQGVLLLNAILTVELNTPAAHQNRGWERFTSRILEVINARCTHVVFILWGSYAQRKGEGIDHGKHLVLTSPHPSPLSAHRGFLGSRPFSQTNHYLSTNNPPAIAWQLPPLSEGEQMAHDEKMC